MVIISKGQKLPLARKELSLCLVKAVVIFLCQLARAENLVAWANGPALKKSPAAFEISILVACA